LALNILDDAELRLGDSSTVMRVQKANFAHKHTEHNGESRLRKTIDKKKATKRIVKMQRKLQEWDDEDGFGPTVTADDSVQSMHRSSRVVVLKHMFTLKQLEEEPSLLIELKEDVRDECATLGEVTNVVLYDEEQDGVMTVKFRDPISAQACVVKMNGRFFDGRRVEALLYSGKVRFKRSGMGDDIDEEGGEGEKKRLEDFAQWLMAEGD